MNDFEILLEEINQEIPVIEGPLLKKGYEGLYRDNRIYLDSTLPLDRKKEILLEEYWHHKTSVGNIINYDTFENRKQEIVARNKAYENIVTPQALINCFHEGLSNTWEVADYLNVSQDFLQGAFQHYRSKYGIVFWFENYQFIFLSDSALDIKCYE